MHHCLTASVPQHVAKRFREVDGCWVWDRAGPNGYGMVMVSNKSWLAHRYMKALEVGEAALEGKVCDHLCRNRLCVNPAHIRVVTQQENVLAEGSLAVAKKRADQTHCPQCGGDYTVYTPKWLKGKAVRRCVPCDSQYKKQWAARKNDLLHAER